MNTTPTQPLNERDRRALELAREWAAFIAHLAAPLPPSSPATEPRLEDAPEVVETWGDMQWSRTVSPATEQREGKPSDYVGSPAFETWFISSGWLSWAGGRRSAGFPLSAMAGAWSGALAAPSPAVDAGVERDAARYRWLRDGENLMPDAGGWFLGLHVYEETEDGPGALDRQLDAALAAMKEPTR